MNIRIRTLLAGAVVVLAAPGAFAQKGDYATFYENGDFRGYSFTLTTSEPNFGRPGLMNDKVSSVRLRGRWLLCTDGDYRGRCEEVSRDYSDLGELRLNDAISSARYLGPAVGPGPGPGFGGPGGAGRPPFADRGKLERDIDRAMDDRDWRRALGLIDQYRALPGRLPPHYLVLEARAALGDGNKRRASNVLDQYFDQTDKRDPDYREARDLAKRAGR